ncbi:MAG: GNAT family N-acetyltransferase [Pseudomonadota bacterium]
MTATVERSTPTTQYEFLLYRPAVTLEKARNDEKTVVQWLEWMNDPEILRFMYDTEPYTKEEIARWVKKVTQDPRRHYFSIRADGKDVGFVSLRQDQAPGTSAEIGIVIGDKDYWDKGVGSQTVKKTLAYAKDTAGLTNIRAMIKPDNERSIRLFTRSGFHEVAEVTVNGAPMIRFEKNLA